MADVIFETGFTMWEELIPELEAIPAMVPEGCYPPVNNQEIRKMANIPKEEKIEIMSKNEDLGFRWIASIDRFVCPSDYVKDMKTWITVNGEYYFKWKKVF